MRNWQAATEEEKQYLAACRVSYIADLYDEAKESLDEKNTLALRAGILWMHSILRRNMSGRGFPLIFASHQQNPSIARDIQRIAEHDDSTQELELALAEIDTNIGVATTDYAEWLSASNTTLPKEFVLYGSYIVLRRLLIPIHARELRQQVEDE